MLFNINKKNFRGVTSNFKNGIIKKNLGELSSCQANPTQRPCQAQPYGGGAGPGGALCGLGKTLRVGQDLRLDRVCKINGLLKEKNLLGLAPYNLQKVSSSLSNPFPKQTLTGPPPKGLAKVWAKVYDSEMVSNHKILTSNYSLDTFYRSNQDTSLVHKPVVFEGQWVEAGDLLADCSASVGGELSLGQNILIGYMPWEGYNFEDAILISERLVYDDLYTSIHIEKYETEIRETKLGIEEITREIPELGKKDLENLDSNGLIKIGSWVEEGDILVGKVTPISKKDQSPYQKLLYTILEKEFLPVCDSSFRAPKGIKAKVIDIKIFKNFLPLSSVAKQNVNKNKKSVNLKSSASPGRPFRSGQTLPKGQSLLGQERSSKKENLKLGQATPNQGGSPGVGKLFKQKEEKKDKIGLEKTGTNSAKQNLGRSVGKGKKSFLETTKLKNNKILLKNGPANHNDNDIIVNNLLMAKLKNPVISKNYFFSSEGLRFQSYSQTLRFGKKLEKPLANPLGFSKPKGLLGQEVSPIFSKKNISAAAPSFYNNDGMVFTTATKSLKFKKVAPQVNPLGLAKPRPLSRVCLVKDSSELISLINKNKPLKNKFSNSPFGLEKLLPNPLGLATHTRQKKLLTKLYFFKKHILKNFKKRFGLAYANPYGLGKAKFLKKFRENLNFLITKKLSVATVNKSSNEAKVRFQQVNPLGLTKSQVDNTLIKKLDKSLKKIIYSNQSTLKNSFISRSLFLEKNQINKKLGATGQIKEEKKIESIEILLAEKRRVQVGDKMAGRHGNKGIISNILPREDMPYLPDGTPLDMVLNPLGVPSRMNVGQIYECLLGFAGRYLGENFKVFPFDEIYGPEASRSFVYSKLFEARKKTGFNWLYDPKNPGKIRLYDGRTGDCFDQPVTVGESYILRLVHMVDDKIHARSTGPYSLVTQQPLRGRSKKGGQRLGEMEVWALEGYGAAFTLLEMLTIKSDDMTGRLTLWSNIILNKDISIGTPESFKVLVCELQALCVDIELFRLNPKKRNSLLMIDNLMNLA